MNSPRYTEDDLVKQPALDLLGELGWETVDAYGEFGRSGSDGRSALGRETEAEVVLTARLRSTLLRLNPGASEEAVDAAIEELVRDRSLTSPAAANREVYGLLKDGVRVAVPAVEDGGEAVEHIRVIDWTEPVNNDFLLCSEFWVAGEMYRCRSDLAGFVNGLPLLFVELKAAHRRLELAYDGNLRHYREEIPQIFWFNAVILLSNGLDNRLGSMTAGWEHFAEWKRVTSEGEPARVSLETVLRGVCGPARLLDLVENFTLFQETPEGLIKLIGKNHQVLGVNNALEAVADVRSRQGRLGVFWHTQGSGKSVSMVFFAQKTLRRVPGNWTFVIVTDRQELDGQIYKRFASSGVVTEKGAQAKSSAHLRRLLREDHRYVFTLVHKFRTDSPGEAHPVLSERDNIVVITDEAHRSQYDTLALNMRQALPKASFLAFTGTPLIQGEEERTREVFGDYVSVYDFRQSVEDRATVPLYYENRVPELQLSNRHLNEDMERLLEQASLDDAQEEKLEREFAREYHLIAREDRLDAVAEDLVRHFSERGFRGKGMVVSIDKATAVRMHDKVAARWKNRIEELREERSLLPGVAVEDVAELDDRIAWMEETDMAVVVSSSQNEIADMKAKGLDFRWHRRRMVEEDLETKFKDAADPFRLVFVCAMWMTGFDVPSCSTLYLDKPMRNHTLMQTIARANRVYPGKEAGLIVDYVGVFRDLERALSIYGAGRGGGAAPAEDKAALIAGVRESLKEAGAFCREQGVELGAIERVEGFRRLELLADAVDALVATAEVKRRVLGLANDVDRLFKAALPDVRAQEFRPRAKLLSVLAGRIRALEPPADISLTMKQGGGSARRVDRGRGLRHRRGRPLFDGPQRRRLREAGGEVRAVEEADVQGEAHFAAGSPGRTDGSRESDPGRLPREAPGANRRLQRRQRQRGGTRPALVSSSRRELNEEERRTLGEELDREELAVFDILTKPEMALTASERKRVKATARELLETLKAGKLTLDWRKRRQARADVRVTIEKHLDEGLPGSYTPELFRQKASAVFQHVYASYYGAGRGVYEAA